jgi:hypothetical protein
MESVQLQRQPGDCLLAISSKRYTILLSSTHSGPIFMASLDSLPFELLQRCVRYLDVGTLRAFRLVSHRASIIGAEQLFYTLVERIKKPNKGLFENDRLEITNHIDQVLDQGTFMPLVRKIVLNATADASTLICNRDLRPGKVPRSEELVRDPKYVDIRWGHVIRNLHRFPLLKEVEIWFRWKCGIGLSFNLEQDHTYRTSFQTLLFDALSKNQLLRGLTIKNIQDAYITRTGPHQASLEVHKRLVKLALMVVTEFVYGSDMRHREYNISAPALHECFNTGLISHWLIPTQPQLTHLTLYCDTYWGVWPLTDLRGVHFPHLTSLALGHWSIAHDWQIEWVASHGETLRELIFDECPIVYLLQMRPDMANANWPEMRPLDNWAGIAKGILRQYRTRWSDILPMFQQRLKHLRYFGMSSGPWFENDSTGNALMFDERYELLARIETSRYIIFRRMSNPHTLPSWLEHVPRDAPDTGLTSEALRILDARLHKRVVQDGDHYSVRMRAPHSGWVEIDEPNYEDDIKDQEALDQFLKAMGKTDEDIERMKDLSRPQTVC